MAGGGDLGGGMTSHRSGSNRKTARLKNNTASISGGLMLASMLDILMAILFFLLKNYSASVSDFSMGKDISLPLSSALNPPNPALQLVVTQKSIVLDDKEI